MLKIEGLIAAPYTPFDYDGELNTSIIPVYANYLKESGAGGVFVNGTTGEGASLSTNERKSNAECWLEQRSSDFKVMVHVGHNSLKVAQDLASHAQKFDADATGAMSPNFFKPQTISSLLSFTQEIASSAADIPFFFYHIPSMTGVDFTMIDFLKKAHNKIPNLAGIKYTHNDFMDMRTCIDFLDNKYTILHGRDEVLICGLVLGIKGAIGSTYNYISPLFIKLLESFHNGNMEEANRLQMKAIEIVQILLKYGGGTRAGKAIMRMVGIDLGQPRKPVSILSRDEESQICRDLEAVDFYKYCLTRNSS